MERMKELIAILNRANRAYYHDFREIIPDYEYDKLYDELKQLESETGVTLAQSPTRNVGYEPVGELKKSRHPSPMLSLDKTKETSRLAEFLGAEKGLLSFKLDGLTISASYDGGELVSLVTRGNGEVGEVVTHNANAFNNLPARIAYVKPLRVRGEAVMPFAEFERINTGLPPEERYKNPRNLASGVIRYAKSETARSVSFVAFSSESLASDKDKVLDFLDSLGFETVPRRSVVAETVESAVKLFESETADFEYPTDGLVLTINSRKISKALGATSKFPRESIAFKWRDETAEATIRSIEWRTSRSGVITPVAVFDTVELEGTEVSRASVHNAGMLLDMGLARGSRVSVYKANMIIPQIAEVRRRETPNCRNNARRATLRRFCWRGEAAGRCIA